MLTDGRADKDGWRWVGGLRVQTKALNLFLSQFRTCRQVLGRAELPRQCRKWAEGNQEDLQRGSKKVAVFLPCLSSSTDLETMDFIPTFGPGKARWCPVPRVGSEDVRRNLF